MPLTDSVCHLSLWAFVSAFVGLRWVSGGDDGFMEARCSKKLCAKLLQRGSVPVPEEEPACLADTPKEPTTQTVTNDWTR